MALGRRGWVAVVTVGVLIAALAVCEWQGWPFLAKPAERWLAARLQRSVSFEQSSLTSLRLQLWGGISVQAGRLEVGNPAWSTAGPLLVATEARLKLRYRDLLAYRQGGPLAVESLEASKNNLNTLTFQ